MNKKKGSIGISVLTALLVICIGAVILNICVSSKYNAKTDYEFYMNYAARNNILCLLDSGHFHPTEAVSDKISSMLVFFEKLALHVSRPMRWDSDHVVLFDDELREIAKEIVRNDALDRVLIATDYFDASINRIAACVNRMNRIQIRCG